MASVASPIPDTSSSSSTAVKAPFSERKARIDWAVTGPTPGSSSSSAWVALLRLTIGVAPPGPVTAQSILAFRSANGAFTAVDELLEVSGIGDATLAKIAPYVTL